MPIKQQPVGVFWDFENCCPPHKQSAHDIVKKLRSTAGVLGNIKCFNAYFDVAMFAGWRHDLTKVRVSVKDCRHDGKKQVADKFLLADLSAFARTQGTHSAVIIITGDGDFTAAIKDLRERGLTVIVIAPPPQQCSKKLLNQASATLRWKNDILQSSDSAHRLQAALSASSLDRVRLKVRLL